MVFLSALGSMASITLLCAVGYLVSRAVWVSRDTEIFIPKLVTVVAIPPFLFGQVVTHFKHDQFLELIRNTLVPLGSILATFALALALAWIFRVDRRHRLLFACAASVSNTLFIGIPVNEALFGGPAITYVILYFFGNTFFFWTIGNWCLAREGEHKERRLTRRELLSRAVSPPLRGLLAGIAVVLLDLPVPDNLLKSCVLLGSLTTPLALLYIGISLERIDWKRIAIGRDAVLFLLMRLAVAPCLLLCCLWLLPLERLASQVFVIQSSLPCMANMALFAAYYGADKEFASIAVATSTLLAMLTVPAWMAVISAAGL